MKETIPIEGWENGPYKLVLSNNVGQSTTPLVNKSIYFMVIVGMHVDFQSPVTSGEGLFEITDKSGTIIYDEFTVQLVSNGAATAGGNSFVQVGLPRHVLVPPNCAIVGEATNDLNFIGILCQTLAHACVIL